MSGKSFRILLIAGLFALAFTACQKKAQPEGVLLEAYSLEDRGAGLSYCIFCPNVQPGIIIDYATGNSRRAEP